VPDIIRQDAFFLHLAPRAEKAFRNHKNFSASIVLAPPITLYCMMRWQRATRASSARCRRKETSTPSSHGGHWDAKSSGEVGAKSKLFCPKTIRDRLVQVPTERPRVVEIGERATFSLFRFRLLELALFQTISSLLFQTICLTNFWLKPRQPGIY